MKLIRAKRINEIDFFFQRVDYWEFEKKKCGSGFIAINGAFNWIARAGDGGENVAEMIGIFNICFLYRA